MLSCSGTSFHVVRPSIVLCHRLWPECLPAGQSVSAESRVVVSHAMATSIFGTSMDELGASVTGVFEIVEPLDHDGCMGMHIPTGCSVLIFGAALAPGRVSIYEGTLADLHPRTITLGPDAWWIQQETCSDLSPKILDLCAGFGAMGLGAKYLGASTIVSVDSNRLAAEHLLLSAHGSVLHLDLADPEAPMMIHRECQGSPGTVFMGFPCQPHSVQGSRHGRDDPRFAVFWHGLRVIFLTQAQTAILECTPAAGCNNDIRDGLQLLAKAMKWDILTVNLDLQHIWPNRRARWWALLLPSSWNTIGLPAWLPTPRPLLIRDILTDWGTWSAEEEAELELTDTELHYFHNDIYGDDIRELHLDMVAATVLHSYGNALQACPCECRSQRFAEATLRVGGLRGFYVKSKLSGKPRWLHPKELALLLGVPCHATFAHPVRYDLSLLGLIASPLQAIWTYGHLLANFQTAKANSPAIPVTAWIHSFKQELITQAMSWMPSKPRTASLQLLASHEHIPAQVSVAHPFHKVQQLLAAERISFQWNEYGSLAAGASLRLPDLIPMSTGDPLQLRLTPGNPDRLSPPQQLAVGLWHQGTLHILEVEAGDFVFQSLRSLHLWDILFVMDNSGRILGADHRIWQPIVLHTLTGPAWTSLPGSFLQAWGMPQASEIGLHDGHVWQCLQKMVTMCDSMPLTLHPAITPAVLHRWISNQHVHALRLDFALSNGCILWIFEDAGHWSLLWGHTTPHGLHWHNVDGFAAPAFDKADQLARALSALLLMDFDGLDFTCLIPQIEPHTCGTIALAHASFFLDLLALPAAEEILHLHQWILQNSTLVGNIYANGPLSGIWPETYDKLKELLASHGVPPAETQDRATHTVQKLGASAVNAAFQSKNAWAHLKSCANKPNIGFRLVHADELARHVERQAASRFGAGVSNHKGKKKKLERQPQASLQIDPASLTLIPGHFQDEEGDQVPQITFDEISAEAVGVAITSLTQGQTWMTHAGSISTGALAVLFTEEPPKDVMTKFNLTATSFPAKYQGTGEPVLIFGAMKQLGDVLVTRHMTKCLTNSIDLVQTTVLRLHVYRDELPVDWKDLTESPVRTLSQLVPLLQLCKGKGCGQDCPKSHSIDEPLDSIMLEVWSRFFGKVEGGKTAPKDATYFSVFLRIPDSFLAAILGSHCNGVYFDPRADNGPDDRYRVIWLSARHLDEALHANKTCAASVGLVRNRHKYGLRVPADEEEQAFKPLKPDAPYIATKVQRIWQFFPLPAGLQRARVIKILESMAWIAKPLQPGKSNSSGMSWLVGSATPPPRDTITCFNQEVLITEVTKPAQERPPAKMVASSKTQQHLRTEKPSSSSAPAIDPWQASGDDPWKSWTGTSSTAGKSKLMEVTAQLRSTVDQRLQQHLQDNQVAASADQEERFTKLETSIDELKAQNTQFTEWFQHVGGQQQAAENAIKTIQYTLNTHQSDLQGLHEEIKTTTSTMERALQSGLQSTRADITQDVGKRFDRLEALLAKRQRVEDHEWLSSAATPTGHRGGKSIHRPKLWSFSFFTWLLLSLFLPGAQGSALARLYIDSTALCDRDLGSELTLEHPVWSLAGQRWGEALHPGPHDQAHLLTIGTTNPSGLRNKEALAIGQGVGIWSYSETQLSHVTQVSCTRALHRIAQRSVKVHCGAPASLRARSSWAGSWSGVLVTSDFSSRRLNIEWPPDVWQSGRVLATQHYIGHQVVTLVSIYGLPRGPTWPKAAELTNSILEHITATFIVGYSGVVVVAGDFNYGPTELPVFNTWRAYGWQCAQDMAAAQWARPKQATCKGSTERDLIWLSPMASMLCKNVEVHDVFMEHSSLQVQLDIEAVPLSGWTWPKPRPIPWDEVAIPDWHQSCIAPMTELPDSSEQAMKIFADSFETSLNGHVAGLPDDALTSAHRGRSQRTAPLKHKPSPRSCRASRPGEVELVSDTVGAAVLCWFKQLRRIQSYQHSIKAGQQHESAVTYRIELWSSIQRARGFHGSFSDWWEQQDFYLATGPLPASPPNVDQTALIFQAFHHEFLKFERWHLSQKNQAIQLKYDRTAKALFTDLRTSKFDQVDFFWDQEEFEIVGIRPASRALLLNRQVPTSALGQWFYAGKQLHPEAYIEEMLLLRSGMILQWETFCFGDRTLLVRLMFMLSSLTFGLHAGQQQSPTLMSCCDEPQPLPHTTCPSLS